MYLRLVTTVASCGLLLIASLAWTEEPDTKALEAQLKLVQSQKTTAQSEIERGRLLMENGQLWLEKFTVQEQALTAKIMQLKTAEKPPDPPAKPEDTQE